MFRNIRKCGIIIICMFEHHIQFNTQEVFEKKNRLCIPRFLSSLFVLASPIYLAAFFFFFFFFPPSSPPSSGASAASSPPPALASAGFSSTTFSSPPPATKSPQTVLPSRKPSSSISNSPKMSSTSAAENLSPHLVRAHLQLNYIYGF